MKKKWRGGVSGDRRGRREEERQTDRQTENGREMGDGQGPFKSEHSECAQEELFVATAEDVAC